MGLNLILGTYLPFSALTLLVWSFGPYKPVTDMTYNAFGGTLNLALSIYLGFVLDQSFIIQFFGKAPWPVILCVKV